MSATLQRKISVGFEQEVFDDIQRIASDLSLSLTETIATLTKIGLENVDGGFPTRELKEIAERRLVLISDIFDFSRTVKGSLPPDDLDLLDQNISERVIAELEFADDNDA